MFGWASFCRERRIDFVEGGAHTQPGNIYIECPWCADGHHYLGLHLRSTRWACWKSAEHRGRKPHRLIRALLNCSWETAEKIVGDVDTGTLTGWDELRARLRPKHEALPEFDVDPELMFLNEERPPIQFRRYLKRRGLAGRDLPGVMWADTGRWKWRIVFPLTDGEDRVTGLTGRAVLPSNLRYLTHGRGLYVPATLRQGGRVLLVVEGIFDQLAIDGFGEPGTRGLAILGLGLNDAKVSRIARIAARFDRVALLLDRGEMGKTMAMARRLAVLDPTILELRDAKDPGSMDASEYGELMAKLHRKIDDVSS